MPLVVIRMVEMSVERRETQDGPRYSAGHSLSAKRSREAIYLRRPLLPAFFLAGRFRAAFLAGFFRAAFLAGFFFVAFLIDFLAVFRADFFTDFFADFLAAFFADFLAAFFGLFLAAFLLALRAGFLSDGAGFGSAAGVGAGA